MLPALALASALAGPTPLGGQTPPDSGEPQALIDLRAVLDTGALIHDRNGDRVVDDLELRVLLSAPDGLAFDTAVDAFLGRDTLAPAGEEPDADIVPDTAVIPDTALAPVEEDPTEVSKPDQPTTLSDLEISALHRLDVRIVGPDRTQTVTLRPEEP